MSIEGVGHNEIKDIQIVIGRLLRDLGSPEPPLRMDIVRQVLELDLKYYSTTEPSLVEEMLHRVRVGTKQLFFRPGLIIDAVKKANISALWVPDLKRIMIDDTVPKLKHRWIEAHEIGHSLIPWHREFLFGDTEYSLDPACHAMVEAEANFAAAQLLFMCGRFGLEARDVEINFSNIKSLAKRYGNTITASLWRFVEERDTDHAVFGMVSCHPRYPDIGSGSEGESVRYFMRSARFRRQFASTQREKAFDIVRRAASWSRRGKIVDIATSLTDVDGNDFEFHIESFCNGYALLTYGALLGQRKSMLAA